MLAIIGKKIGMTQFFDEAGVSHAATVVEAGPCHVTQIKTSESDGYSAIQVGYGNRSDKKMNKPIKGHLEKSGGSFALLREFRDFESKDPLNVGDEIKIDIFNSGDNVQITGFTKGKGFAGVMRRYNFSGGPKTHGQSDRWRAPGSIGQSSSPSKVIKGIHMGGRMGGTRETTRNLLILKVDPENNLLIVRGAVPGANKGILLIRK